MATSRTTSKRAATDRPSTGDAPRTRNRMLVVACLAAVAIAAPASAADRFEDVNANSTHASAIGQVADAGVTLGCATGRYCPGDPVNRDQMASFMTRLGSRSSYAANATELTSANGYDGVPASVTVEATGGSGGTAMVTLNGSVSVHASSSEGGNVSSCPCEVEAFIYRDGDDSQGPSSWAQLPGTFSGSGRAGTSLAVSWAAPIPSGTTETFRIAVFLADGSPTGVRVDAALTAVATPF